MCVLLFLTAAEGAYRESVVAMRIEMFLATLAMATCCAAAQSEAGDPGVIRPASGGPVTTPLSATLAWSDCPGASSYQLALSLAGVRKPVLETRGLEEPVCRVAVRPNSSYEWRVCAVDSSGKTIARSEVSEFTTPGTAPSEVTDFRTLFAGVHPGSHWQAMEEIPADPTARISPWFDKKRFDHQPPPTMHQVKDKLPVPVWDGHEDLIGMYWYAWDTLFSVWLFAPKSADHMAVSNLIGLPSWGPWGSTMVWDTAFILQFARYGHWAYPFITGLDNCYARQHENGFICRESDSNNREVYVIYPANPPLLAWAEWQYYQATGDCERLRSVFLPLVKQYEWYMLYQRRSNGLYWSNTFQEADDSPRNALVHSAVSTTAIQAMSADILARMAGIIGRRDMAQWFDKESATLKNMVNASFWDEDHKLYNDLGTDGKPITVTEKGGVCKHVHMFWPMLAGIATTERCGELARHLADPRSFNRASGTASLSADSAGYNKENGSYWKGAVWPPTQYMAIKGLEVCGNESLAFELASKYVNAALTAFRKQGDITEYLAPDRPEGHGCGKFVGWGGLAPIALLFEDLIGVRVSAPSNTLTWRVRQLERHGIENLRFGDRVVSIICGPRASKEDPCSISVVSDGDFRFVVELPWGSFTRSIHRGRQELRFAKP